jgi:hypothetical protein
VLLNPESGPFDANSVSLESFVRYKCDFLNVKPEHKIAAALDELGKQLGLQWCNGERDARCLPLHTFAPKKDWANLESDEGVKLFERSHGPATQRIDAAERQWQVATAMHGGESAYVGGVSIRSGFHWDVQGVGDGSNLYNSAEVWRLGKGNYLNISPNAHIRQGARGRTGIKVFAAKRPDIEVAKVKKKKPSRSGR